MFDEKGSENLLPMNLVRNCNARNPAPGGIQLDQLAFHLRRYIRTRTEVDVASVLQGCSIFYVLIVRPCVLVVLEKDGRSVNSRYLPATWVGFRHRKMFEASCTSCTSNHQSYRKCLLKKRNVKDFGGEEDPGRRYNKYGNLFLTTRLTDKRLSTTSRHSRMSL